jgi:hypothetical protein
VLAVILALGVLVGCGESVVVKEWDQGESWDQWARGVEARFPVGDARGHGPDLGSAEWRAAVEEKIGGLGE